MPQGSRRPEKQFWSRARRAVAGEFRQRPLRYMFRFSACAVFAWMLATQQVTQGHMDPIWAVFLLLFLSLTVIRLISPIFSKGQELRDWAIEEQEHERIKNLTGKTQEELEEMLQYQLKYGNLEEADRISQKLLAMVDGNAPSDEQKGVSQASAPSDQPAAQKGLPSWMQQDAPAGQGATDSQEQQAPGKEKRPEWMQ